MWHLFVLLFFFRILALENIAKILTTGPRLLLVMCLLLLFHNFWAVDLLTPVSAAVLYHTRFSDSFIPDFFSSMQNVYTFSIIAPASSLYLHTCLAILLSEVALHVHNTSEHAFFCKHVNREKFLLLCESKKKNNNNKTRLYWGSNPQLSCQILWVQPLYLLRHRIACKISLVNTNKCMA